MTYEEKYKKLLEYIDSKVYEDFDYDVKHWETGSNDDSYEYGVETGEQYAYREIVNFMTKGDDND